MLMPQKYHFDLHMYSSYKYPNKTLGCCVVLFTAGFCFCGDFFSRNPNSCTLREHENPKQLPPTQQHSEERGADDKFSGKYPKALPQWPASLALPISCISGLFTS